MASSSRSKGGSGGWKRGTAPGNAIDEAWLQARNDLARWPTLEGTVDERYRNNDMQVIGYGAFGLVFRATRKSDGVTVAVKLVVNDPRVFLRELRALIFLRERHACDRLDMLCYVDNFKAVTGQRLLDEIDRFAGNTNLRLHHFAVPLDNPAAKSVFIEMRYVAGQNMHEFMKTHKPNTFPFEENAHMLLSMLRALAFMHQNKMAHRDVKPANIMVVNGDSALVECVLIDVGDSCRVEKASVPFRIGACDDYGGTHAFLSPGVIALEATNFQASKISLRLRKAFDVYALGLTFYDWGRNDTMPAALSEEEAIALVRNEYDHDNPPARMPREPYFPAHLDNAEGSIALILEEMLVANDEERIDADVAADFLEDVLKKHYPSVSELTSSQSDEMN
jgi:serine/threonine protein kinase